MHNFYDFFYCFGPQIQYCVKFYYAHIKLLILFYRKKQLHTTILIFNTYFVANHEDTQCFCLSYCYYQGPDSSLFSSYKIFLHNIDFFLREYLDEERKFEQLTWLEIWNKHDKLPYINSC